MALTRKPWPQPAAAAAAALGKVFSPSGRGDAYIRTTSPMFFFCYSFLLNFRNVSSHVSSWVSFKGFIGKDQTRNKRLTTKN